LPPNGLSLLASSTFRIISLSVLSNASKHILFIIGASSQIIKLIAIRSLARRLPCAMLQVDSSLINSGMQKVECAVFPLGSSKEAIPLYATFKTIMPLLLRAADNVFHIKVFPVPP